MLAEDHQMSLKWPVLEKTAALFDKILFLNAYIIEDVLHLYPVLIFCWTRSLLISRTRSYAEKIPFFPCHRRDYRHLSRKEIGCHGPVLRRHCRSSRGRTV